MALKRNIKTKAEAATVVFLIAVVLLFLNFISFRHFFRIDLTEDHEYTLSAPTKKLLGSLEDRVIFKLYMNANLPPHLTELQHGITDLLDEYKKVSHGKISIEQISPNESVQKEQEAQMLGIPPLQLNVIQHDKQEVIKVYLGLALFYGDKKEVIPVIADLRDYEYNLTSSLLKLTTKKIPNIGLMVPETNSNDSDYKNVQAIFEKQYHLTAVANTDTDLVSKNLDALVVVNPRNIPPTLTKELDQLFEKGVPLLIFVGRVDVDGRLMAYDYATGLEDWLSDHGIELSNKLVIDFKSHTYAAFSSGLLQYHIPYPFFVKTPKEAMNTKNPVTARLEDLVFPWANSLIIHADKHPDWKYENLVETSDEAVLQEGAPDISPDNLDHLDTSGGAKHTLAIEVTAPVEAGKPSRRLAVVANNQFIKDNFLNDFDSNILFPLNLVDSVTWGDDLIGIRSRGQTDRPLEIPSSGVIAFIKFFHMLGIPLIVIFGGFGLTFWRRTRWKRHAGLDPASRLDPGSSPG